VGQRPNTRARAILARVSEKTQQAADTYRAAYRALCSLDVDGDWQTQLLELLRAKDLTFPCQTIDPSEKSRESEGRFKPSWIWLASRSSTLRDREEEEVSSFLRSEWLQARARKMRWSEEVELLQEETLKRTLRWLEVKSEWWVNLAYDPPPSEDPWVQAGRSSYLHRQADYVLNH
jgi:hypothetical protein